MQISFLLFNTFFFTLLLFCAFVAWSQWRQSKDPLILWYIGYLLCTFAHYGRQFWISGAEEWGFIYPPNPPLRWDSALSYAAFACYFMFIERLMNKTALNLSRFLSTLARLLTILIGFHLLLQVVYGRPMADKFHQAFQIILFPVIIWIAAHLLRNARLFYQKLVLIGVLALIIGFICVIATRAIPGWYDSTPDVIRRFPTPWGEIPLYHLKVGIAIDVICFSWALTLRQRDLLASALLSALPSAQTTIILPLVDLPEDTFLVKIREFLEQNFHHESLNVTQLARAVFLSADQITRKMKEKTGLTTEQYILRYRLERALGLLRTTDMSVGEITLAIGLKDTAHFSRAFKKHYGKNPTEIRKRG